MKKFLAITIMLIMLCVVFTACGTNTQEIEELYRFADQSFDYVILKQVNVGTYAKIINYKGTEYYEKSTDVVHVEVPSKVSYNEVEYDIKVIGNLAFNRKKVTQIDVGEGIAEIESFAFGYCEVSVVNMPSTINSIGEYAFVGCNNFGTLNLSATVPPTLGAYAFKVYNNDKNVYMVNAKLRINVPQFAFESYKTASAWHDYAGIVLAV